MCMAASSCATTATTASATPAPPSRPRPRGVATRASATTRAGGIQCDAEHLGATDVDAERHVGHRRRAGAGHHAEDSTRAFSSRMAVDMMRLWARILMKPGIGTRSSASKWYVTSVPEPSPGSKT